MVARSIKPRAFKPALDMLQMSLLMPAIFIERDDLLTMETPNARQMLSGLQGGSCADCIFWYQCRQGKVDCRVMEKAPQN
ncbi:MAG TPA: hypothetical protein VMC84_07730 [Methanocella sp.]|uniref:hypothetical protein n=1 Tax=Methanocella sp. TaxID=2052833 RepID=UPI002C37A22C|nr:hypothetical protein [Methanocella sp.]HTY91048.1 hypothetical protein [Methanocella sp.]